MKIINKITELFNQNNKKKSEINFSENSTLTSFNFNNNMSESLIDHDNIKEINEIFLESFYNILKEIANFVQESDNNFHKKNSSENNKKNSIDEKTLFTSDICLILFEYTSLILSDNSSFKYFEELKFTELIYIFLISKKYQTISFKLIELVLKFSNDEEEVQAQLKLLTNESEILLQFDINESANNEDEIRKINKYFYILNTMKVSFMREISVGHSKTNNEYISMNSGGIIDLNRKILDTIFKYGNYLLENSNIIINIFNDDIHNKIKEYVNMVMEYIEINNKNLILKINKTSPQILYYDFIQFIKALFKFYLIFHEQKKIKFYLLDIIQLFINISINLKVEYKFDINKVSDIELISEKDFTLYYKRKFGIIDDNYNQNNNNYNEIFVQSPMILIAILDFLSDNNIFIENILNLILFFIKINNNNIHFLLHEKIINKLFDIINLYNDYYNIISSIIKVLSKFMGKEDVRTVFEQLIKLSNKIEKNEEYNSDFSVKIINIFGNSLREYSENDSESSKGINLSENNINQPNLYNGLVIDNINYNEKQEILNNNIIFSQDIFFNNITENSKLFLMKLTKENDYIIISLKNNILKIEEKCSYISYTDNNNNNQSIEIALNDFIKKNAYNSFIFCFNPIENKLSINVNKSNILNYEYNFDFNNDNNIIFRKNISTPISSINNINRGSVQFYIGFDKITKINGKKLNNFTTIKLLSMKIAIIHNQKGMKAHNEEYEKVIFNLNSDKIQFEEMNLSKKEIYRYKISENAYVISNYNPLETAVKGYILNHFGIKKQLYEKILFKNYSLSESLDFSFRLEKYFFVLLNQENLQQALFKALIDLLTYYFYKNSKFFPMFLNKEEFISAFYFSILKNIHFLDKEIVDTIYSMISISSEVNFSIILEILLDDTIFNLIEADVKYEVIYLLKKKLIINNPHLCGKIFAKLVVLLLICSEKEDDIKFNSTKFQYIKIDNEIISILLKILDNYYFEPEYMDKLEQIFNMTIFTVISKLHIINSGKEKYERKINELLKTIFKKVYNVSIDLYELLFTFLNQILINKNFPKRSLPKFTRIKIELSNKIKLIKEGNKEKDVEIKKEYKRKLSDEFLYESTPNKNENKNKENDIMKKRSDDSKGLEKITSTVIKPSKISIGNYGQISNTNFNDEYINKTETKKKRRNSTGIKENYNYNNSDLKKSLNYSKYPPEDPMKSRFDDDIKSSWIMLNDENSGIKITLIDKETFTCKSNCPLCKFIKNLMKTKINREIKFNIYKDYLCEIYCQIFLMNCNLNFNFNFSYYLQDNEGPSRIRKKFELKVDRIMNSELDRKNDSSLIKHNISKDNSNSKGNECESNDNIINKINSPKSPNKAKEAQDINSFKNSIDYKFAFYQSFPLSKNLSLFFNLGQIFKINFIEDFLQEEDTLQGVYNCLISDKMNYLNGVLILSQKNISLIYGANISYNNILYFTYKPIKMMFWVVKDNEKYLENQCTFNLGKEDLSEFNDSKLNQNIRGNESMNDNSVLSGNSKKTNLTYLNKKRQFLIKSFEYLEISEIHKNKFLHQNNALEIFLENGKNYYLVFPLQDRNKVFEIMVNNIASHQKGKEKNFLNFQNSDNSTRKRFSCSYDALSYLESIGLESNNNKNINVLSKNEKNNKSSYELLNNTKEYIQNDSSIYIKNYNFFIPKSKITISAIVENSHTNNKKSNKDNYHISRQKMNILKYGQKCSSLVTTKEILDLFQEKWSKGEITNYAYIMLINTLSGRSYNDLAQYPIYPWVLRDYVSDNIDLTENSIYRDFKYPIYAQDKESRENLKIKYDSIEENALKYHSGSHYSNAGFVCYYLIRIKPFSEISAEIQGNCFDTPDRLFFNIQNMYDVREKYQELIPDVFNLPEMFVNVNNFNFGKTSSEIEVDDVVLPPWALNSPRMFTKMCKKALESRFVSCNINDWIDLIFGYKQKGSEAVESFNILREVCSSFNPNQKGESEADIEAKINELVEMGISPEQLFFKSHPNRERHKKVKSFLGRNVFLTYLKPNENKILIENFTIKEIKEIRYFFEYSNSLLYKGEGGLSSFRTYFERQDDYEQKKKDKNENKIKNKLNEKLLFVAGKDMVLLPPSYQNYMKWKENELIIVKPFEGLIYNFKLNHMKGKNIKEVKVTEDGKYFIVGYDNGTIEKYRLKEFNEVETLSMRSFHLSISELGNRTISQNVEMPSNQQPKAEKPKKSLIKRIFGKKEHKSKGPFGNQKESINIDQNEEVYNTQKNNDKISNNIGFYNISWNTNKKIAIDFDTRISVSCSNILNSDCILLNNSTTKFNQINAEISHFNVNSIYHNQYNYESYSAISSDNGGESLKKLLKANISSDDYESKNNNNYYLFFINSTNQILSEIILMDICESFGILLVADRRNYLYFFNLNSFKFIKMLDFSSIFLRTIKYSNINPYTGDSIVATEHNVILLSINGVIISQIYNSKTKINSCFIDLNKNTQSELFLFTAHDDGNLIISRLIYLNNNEIQLNKENENQLNAQKLYKKFFDTNNEIDCKSVENKITVMFDTLIKIKCCDCPIIYLKLVEENTEILCVNSKNEIVFLDYDDFFDKKRKTKNTKNIKKCPMCQCTISSSKIFCQLCGKKLCNVCKIEMIIEEYSLKVPKPICEDCEQAIHSTNKMLYDF